MLGVNFITQNDGRLASGSVCQGPRDVRQNLSDESQVFIGGELMSLCQNSDNLRFNPTFPTLDSTDLRCA
jgi:hypothetical protein